MLIYKPTMSSNTIYRQDTTKSESLDCILPLVPIAVKKGKGEYLTFKLRAEPAEEKSTTYDFQINKITGNEKPREVIIWYQAIKKVLDS